MQDRDEREEALSPYQQAIRQVLEEIAKQGVLPGDNISEMAVFVRTAPADGTKDWRDIVRAAFELAADRGHWRRSHNHWNVLRRFRPVDVQPLLSWGGRWPSFRGQGSDLS